MGNRCIFGNIFDPDDLDPDFTLFISAMFVMASIFSSSVACVRHFSLRLVLYRTRSIPWNYACFLKYSTDRLLLPQVGGRYRFIHRLVQERFAAIPLEW